VSLPFEYTHLAGVRRAELKVRWKLSVPVRQSLVNFQYGSNIGKIRVTKEKSILVLLFKVLVFYEGRDLLSSTQDLETLEGKDIEGKSRRLVCWLAALEELVIDGHW
jgi:hypothetical protein